MTILLLLPSCPIEEELSSFRSYLHQRPPQVSVEYLFGLSLLIVRVSAPRHYSLPIGCVLYTFLLPPHAMPPFPRPALAGWFHVPLNLPKQRMYACDGDSSLSDSPETPSGDGKEDERKIVTPPATSAPYRRRWNTPASHDR
jgi:hypothetical protein